MENPAIWTQCHSVYNKSHVGSLGIEPRYSDKMNSIIRIMKLLLNVLRHAFE